MNRYCEKDNFADLALQDGRTSEMKNQGAASKRVGKQGVRNAGEGMEMRGLMALG
ncbi:hypothetical protein Bra5_CH02649 [Rhizobium phaseoli Brasil 5]|nr:hypothetical protein Bra5_CH02649 [Rhizobium phaseoli Brasil 5]